MRIKSEFTEDSTATLRGLVTDLPTSPDETGTPLVQADIDTINLWAYSDGELVDGFDGVSLDPAEVIYDELQGWELDDTGFNFKYVVDADAFPTGNAKGQILVKFVKTTGEILHIEFYAKVQNVLSS